MVIPASAISSRAHSQGKLQCSASADVLATICLASVIFSYGCSVGREPPPSLRFEQIPEKSLSGRADPADASVRREEPRGIYHKLEYGQTLDSLSRLYEVPLYRLMRLNRISDPTRVQAGTLIFIPGSFRPVGPQATAIAALSWPLRGPITANFGPRGNRSRHEGIDIDGNYGDTVAAAAGGTVIQAGTGGGGYGRMVLLDHGGGLTTLYAHLSRLLVRAGDRVERGDPVAMVGRSGNATGPHLHFEVHRNGQPVDPIPYLQTEIVDRRDSGIPIGGATGPDRDNRSGDQLQAREPKREPSNRTSPREPIIVERDGHEEVVVVELDRSAVYPRIPPGHLPPPGKCRIWLPDRPPGHQPPPGDCRTLELQVPPGAHLIHGG